MRLLVRCTRPSARQLKKLTDFEKKTGWRYAITATNIRHMWGIAGSHQPQWLDALARARAQVEDRVRCNKSLCLHNLPSQDWTVNRAWMLTCNLAADLDAWTRLLGLHNIPDLAAAEPDTMSYRLYHLPAKLTRHARRRWLTLSRTWPWRDAFTTCWKPPRGATRPKLTRHQYPDETGRNRHTTPVPWNPGASAATREGLTHEHEGQKGRIDKLVNRSGAQTNRGQP